MNNFEPLVSIIIPVFNGSNYMREAIDSALAQTYTNIEIIVVNDGSNDNGATEKIALEYGKKIKYICKENGGVSTALNTGIRNMASDYFSWLSHDDVYTPDKIQKSIEALKKCENKKTIVYCGSCHIDKKANEIISTCKREFCKSGKVHSWQEVLMMLQKQGSMNGCAFLIHKDILFECGLFDENLRFNQDSFMWNKMFLKKYSLIWVSDVCVKNRIHDRQLTQTGQQLFRSDCKIMSEYLIPELLKVSTIENNIIYQYIKMNAKYKNKEIVKLAYQNARKFNLISYSECVGVGIWQLYGYIRPVIRKIYYRLFRKIKTA